MVIHVLDVFLRREHVVVLQRLPSPILGIVRCVEDDAMRVQVGIGWELPKNSSEYLTHSYGFITDYLAESFHY